MVENVGVIGLGFVGNALYQSFIAKSDILNVSGYDKYKNGGIGSIKDMINTDIVFLCLPTLYSEDKKTYDLEALFDVCQALTENQYKGVVVVKSTILPGTCNMLVEKYGLSIIHNPEFLSAKTANQDFENQKHIVIGVPKNVNKTYGNIITRFYQQHYTLADISVCGSNESETMKICANSYYAVKIQFFNEIYLLCQKQGTDFDQTVSLMLKNGWINPMHTNVPGHDGSLSYGGACFPKDTQALLALMKKEESAHQVLEACVKERNHLRKD